MPRLLVVDPDDSFQQTLKAALTRSGLILDFASTGREALARMHASPLDSAILELHLPDQSGLDLLSQIQQIDPLLPVIVVAANSTTAAAIQATQQGAFEYLLKPIEAVELQTQVARALKIRRQQATPPPSIPALSPAETAAPGPQLIGQSPPMQEVYKAIGRVASENVSVLILGESGTGKELVAQAIYQYSQRSEAPFLAINCAALPEPLLESELFGHERGAFTGAEQRHIGKFEQADGGTLFLDELGDLSLTTQAKLLRVLQDGRFERVGGHETIQSDVRLLAATNQDLTAKIDAGEFRLDLFYRLNGFTIPLPPLRERRDDLPALIEYFLRQIMLENQRPTLRLADETFARLRACPWPGNVRELQSVLRYAAVHAVTDLITVECLPEPYQTPQAPPDSRAVDYPALNDLATLVRQSLASGQTGLYRQLLAHFDRVVLAETLQHVHGNQVHASQRLGISRSTLRAKLTPREQPIPEAERLAQ